MFSKVYPCCNGLFPPGRIPRSRCLRCLAGSRGCPSDHWAGVKNRSGSLGHPSFADFPGFFHGRKQLLDQVGPGRRALVPSPGHWKDAAVRADEKAVSAGHGETYPEIAHGKSQVPSQGAKGFAPCGSGLAMRLSGLHFFTVFKREVGCTPREGRNELT